MPRTRRTPDDHRDLTQIFAEAPYSGSLASHLRRAFGLEGVEGADVLEDMVDDMTDFDRMNG